MTLPGFLSVHSDGLLLAVKLQPRASVNEIGEPLGNELRVRVTAPPVDSAANEAVLRLLAERLDCARNQVELVRGHTSRHKVVKLRGLQSESWSRGCARQTLNSEAEFVSKTWSARERVCV